MGITDYRNQVMPPDGKIYAKRWHGHMTCDDNAASAPARRAPGRTDGLSLLATASKLPLYIEQKYCNKCVVFEMLERVRQQDKTRNR